MYHLRICFDKKAGEIKYDFTFKETPLSDESDKVKVISFIEDFIRHRIISDEDLGLYEYEIIGDEEDSIEKIACIGK